MGGEWEDGVVVLDEMLALMLCLDRRLISQAAVIKKLPWSSAHCW